ncbi:MAG: DUF4465 domain-containing protein [Chitinophagales bacterium]
MKKFTLFLLALAVSGSLFSQTVADFENLTLAPNSYYNGSDLAGGFSSGNAYFVNDYDTSFMAWSGFAYSNITDDTTAGWGNQYSAITGGGYNGSANYAVGDEYGNAKVRFTGAQAGQTLSGMFVTNGTYPYFSMKDGDAFAKKFGGPTGTDPDWFMLRVLGWYNGALKQQAVDFYLADFRSPDSTQDYIVRDWRWLDLTALGNVDSIQFILSSSDTSGFGMNTPAYFCIDQLSNNVAPVAGDDGILITYLQDTLINVLGNDFDTTLSPLTVTVVKQPLVPGATAVVQPSGDILYTPAPGILSIDTFYYKVCDAADYCDTARVIVYIEGINGITETTASSISVYPNPFKDALEIRSALPMDVIQVFDLNGRLVEERRSGEQFAKLNLSSLPTGIYAVKVSTVTGVSVHKVNKQ